MSILDDEITELIIDLATIKDDLESNQMFLRVDTDEYEACDKLPENIEIYEIHNLGKTELAGCGTLVVPRRQLSKLTSMCPPFTT